MPFVVFSSAAATTNKGVWLSETVEYDSNASCNILLTTKSYRALLGYLEEVHTHRHSLLGMAMADGTAPKQQFNSRNISDNLSYFMTAVLTYTSHFHFPRIPLTL